MGWVHSETLLHLAFLLGKATRISHGEHSQLSQQHVPNTKTDTKNNKQNQPAILVCPNHLGTKAEGKEHQESRLCEHAFVEGLQLAGFHRKEKLPGFRSAWWQQRRRMRIQLTLCAELSVTKNTRKGAVFFQTDYRGQYPCKQVRQW